MKAPSTPIEKLDTVLYILSLSPEKNLGGIQQYLKDNYNCAFSVFDLRKIAKRLDKDGYIEYSLPNGDMCRISFDGEVFLSAGGYMAKAFVDENNATLTKLAIEHQRTLEANSETNQKRLNDLTLYLAIGTGALALIEIVKFFVWLFSTQKSL